MATVQKSSERPARSGLPRSGFPQKPIIPTFPPVACSHVAAYPQMWVRILRPATFQNRVPSGFSWNSTDDCPIFDATDIFQPGYKQSCGVSAKATQDMGVLYLTHPTWGTSFTTASILQRAQPQGPIDRSWQSQQSHSPRQPNSRFRGPWLRRMGICASKSPLWQHFVASAGSSEQDIRNI